MAARSPACWIAGPDEMRMGAPISAAMIMAKVVLPNPGGPESRTWSGVPPRLRAAASTRPSWSATRFWPWNSARALGRRATSSAFSGGSAHGVTGEVSMIGRPFSNAPLSQHCHHDATSFARQGCAGQGPSLPRRGSWPCRSRRARLSVQGGAGSSCQTAQCGSHEHPEGGPRIVVLEWGHGLDGLLGIMRGPAQPLQPLHELLAP